jgi:polyphosphate kinase
MVKRVEILFPIFDTGIKKRIIKILKTQLNDNVKARVQGPDGVYRYKEKKDSERLINSQEIFLKEAFHGLIDEE